MLNKFFNRNIFWWIQSVSNRPPSVCKTDALPNELWTLTPYIVNYKEVEGMFIEN